MKIRIAITILLLAYVAWSTIVLFAKEPGTMQSQPLNAEVERSGDDAATTALSENRDGSDGMTGSASSGDTQDVDQEIPERQIVVYYFYTTIRCSTCINIEKLTKQAVEEGFPYEVADRTIVFQALNTDDPENEHFLLDYNLYNKSVIVSDQNKGVVTRWKNLDSIWELESKESDFISYIQDGVKTYLNEAGE